MTFPSRDQAEVTCGQLYSHPDGDKLGVANERQTYESIAKRYWTGNGCIPDNSFAVPKRVYVKHGCVQCKISGKRYTYESIKALDPEAKE